MARRISDGDQRSPVVGNAVAQFERHGRIGIQRQITREHTDRAIHVIEVRSDSFILEVEPGRSGREPSFRAIWITIALCISGSGSTPIAAIASGVKVEKERGCPPMKRPMDLPLVIGVENRAQRRIGRQS